MGFCCDFTELEDEEESESSFSSPPDSASIASDRCDKDDEAHSDGMCHCLS